MHDSVPADPVLDRVVEAWPNLPDPIRAAIATLVQAASKPVT